MRTLAALAACALLAAAACEDASTSSSFEESAADAGAGAGAHQLRAEWRYRSAEVDVDIELITVEGSEQCTTTARLRVDEALEGARVYRLDATPCSDLRLGDDGDLVLRLAPTGHDWSAEAIDVDLDHEVIRMGPWHDEDHAISYRFALGSPPCSDDPDCECPRIERRAGSETSTLELAHACD